MHWKRRQRAPRAQTPPIGFRLDGPNPVKVELTQLHPVPVPGALRDGDSAPVRKIYCPHYAQCLDVAAREGWDDFTCRQCPLAEKAEEPSAAALAEDRPGTHDI